MTPFHLLISEGGTTLPSWQKVFQNGRVIALTDESPHDEIDLVWFKLSLHEEAKPQLDWVMERFGQYKVVIMSNIPRFEEAVMCLGLGVRAYVNTHAGPNTLQQISDIVYEGGIWLGADLMQALIAKAQTSSSSPESEKAEEGEWQHKLTKREIDVAKLIAEGASNKLVARQLDISERTVKAHVTAIFAKLGVADRLKLALLLTSHKIE
jgi:DNA-binding NarL/FixJ family response regulator